MATTSMNCWVCFGTILLLTLTALQGARAEVMMSLPDQLEAMIGGSVQLRCTHEVTGTPTKHMVEWFVDGKNGVRERIAYTDLTSSVADQGTEYWDRVSSHSDYTLHISGVELIDERTFYCQVTAGPSGSGEGMTNLKVYAVPEKPEISHKKEALAVTVNPEPLEIATCSSKNGYPVPKITWYKNDVPLETNTERNDEMYMAPHTAKEPSGLYTVSSTLFMKISKEDKGSEFHCTVEYMMPGGETHSLESAKSQRVIHYYTEDVTFELVQPKIIKEGDTVTLKCKADGEPSPEFQFYKMEDDDQKEINTDTSATGILVFENINKHDTGTYKCEALDFDSPSDINLQRQISIMVNYLDPLTVQPSETVTVLLGRVTEVSCNTTGSQTPKIMWKKDGEHVSQNHILTLQDVSYKSSGTYTCEASVPSVPGLIKTHDITIVVKGKPMVEEINSDYPWEEDNRAVLTCSAVGNPLPEITWSVPKVQPETSQSEKGVTSTLTVEVTPELEKSGVKCTATNEFSSDMKTIQLDKQQMKEVSPDTAGEADRQQQGGSSAAVIAVVVCVLVLLIVVGLIYFLQKSGKLPCGRSEKKSITEPETKTEDIVVEMKTDRPNEEAGLLGLNSDKRHPEQC